MFGLETQSRAQARSCQLWSRQWCNSHLIPLNCNLMVGYAPRLLLGLTGERNQSQNTRYNESTVGVNYLNSANVTLLISC